MNDEQLKRNERIAVMTRILVDTPSRLSTTACERFGAAKSSIEDMIYDDTLRQNSQACCTIAGGRRRAACGSMAQDSAFLRGVSQTLCEPERMLPGGYSTHRTFVRRC